MDSARIKENDEYLANEGRRSSSAADSIAGNFDGFLTIRSLRLDQNQLVSEPETPTFAVGVIGKETSLSENNFKLINEEVEKVLNAEGNNKDDILYCSDLWPERAGHLSTITISENIDQAINGSGSSEDTPYQGYLGVPTESTIVARKKHPPSLGDVSIKKFLKWWQGKCIVPTSAADPDSAENKLQTESQIFGRKVHTRGSTVAQRSQKSHKNKSHNKTSNTPSYNSNYYYYGNNAALSILTDVELTLFPKRTPRSHQTRTEGYKIKDSNICTNREYWVKTDADYLVLELEK
ncbi:hypothetical protein MKW98_004144 [Papaver atlanticum]|uniref:Uncharacterized protein n=1 Tax=Papaver atlanticum TaxID=357466 RepID=A0AAD4T153_9MAGN|nr:hypothetical protein MKW98_004144 [Papaver atlanticum]